MKKEALITPQAPAKKGPSRRNFLSFPVVAGGLLMLKEGAAAAPPELMSITLDAVRENISSADSVILYADLLPEIRRSEFDKKLRDIGLLKELASGRLQALIQLADSLGAKYPIAATADKDQLFADFKLLVRRFKNTEGIKEVLERSRNQLPELAQIDAKIDSVRDSLMQASILLNQLKAESLPTIPLVPSSPIVGTQREKATGLLDDAIRDLLALLGREVNEDELYSPTERLIVLLRGVKVVVARESGRENLFRRNPRHHTALPASSIMGVLRKYVSPGSFWQLGIGYGVAFPVLLRNSDRTIREKLLMDGLRLVPGLVASALENAAKELAKVSL